MADPIANSRFRYVDAGDLEDARDLDGIDVRNDAGDKLGEVDGYIVDAVSARPYYLVIESGGWFSGGRYLLPINHGRLVHDAGDDEDVLRVNLPKDAITHYPKFDKDEFARLNDVQLHAFETRIGESCCPEDARTLGSEWNHERWAHYREPDWWTARRARTDARGAEPWSGGTVVPARERNPYPDRIIAQEGQPAGNRAQPGDVLGIESEGEETHLGDTARDEERRVEDSDRAARNRKDERG